MRAGQWYTLIRFHGDPQHLTGVSQARTALEALTQLQTWEDRYPSDTTVVFDCDNRPIARPLLEALARGQHPPHQQSGA